MRVLSFCTCFSESREKHFAVIVRHGVTDFLFLLLLFVLFPLFGRVKSNPLLTFGDRGVARYGLVSRFPVMEGMISYVGNEYFRDHKHVIKRIRFELEIPTAQITRRSELHFETVGPPSRISVGITGFTLSQ